MSGNGEMKNKYIYITCCFAFTANLVLFGIKLYIGLKSNSISIFSDAINNLFDSLSGLISFLCLYFINLCSDSSLKGTLNKSEQLFSFLISVIIMLAGCYFAYTSLERMMYPTPVWFTYYYVGVLSFTAVAKLLMCLVFNFIGKKHSSPLIKVLKTDSVLDFFITLITILTLIVSNYGSYSYDALFGIVISVIIIVSAFKLIIRSGKNLINYVSIDTRNNLYEIFEKYADDVKINNIMFYVEDDITAYLTADISDYGRFEAMINDCYSKTEVTIKLIEQENSNV